jgi:hypothetical protein
MKTKRRTFRISLDEPLARWIQAEAARRKISVSMLVAELLRGKISDDRDYDRAMRGSLAREPFLQISGDFLTRDQAHARRK